MNFNRRIFFSLLLASSPQASAASVAVLEVFGEGAAGAAALVHQANAASREAFANWLQSHPNSRVRVRNATGDEAPARIFRVRMCFGRGLILFDRPLRIREGDVLTIAG